ncbi:MAG: decaprenyl-phosphate phosphoribosyltransferase [Methylococcales bacterium]
MLLIIKETIRLLRVRQYIKNTFVLIGVVFARQWDPETLNSAGLAFLSFCAISSAAYVLNDILDAEADRQHPVKKDRAIASGTITTRTALILSLALACFSLLIASLVNSLVVFFVFTYACLNIAYSWRLKHIAILDVFVISAGFMLRLLAGTAGLAITPSNWLLLCSLMLTLFLGFTKRRAELLTLTNLGQNNRAQTRRVLDQYTSDAIEQFIAISATCTILSYSLYSVSSQTIEKHGSSHLIYTVPFVIYGIYRYILILHIKEKGHDAVDDLYTDPQLIVTLIAWLVTTLSILA